MTRKPGNVPAMRVSGEHSATTTVIAASTQCASRARDDASVTRAGTGVTVGLSALVTTHPVSSLRGDASAGRGSGVNTVNATASASMESVTRPMGHVHVNPDTGGSCAGNHVLLGFMDKTAETDVVTVKASSPVRLQRADV